FRELREWDHAERFARRSLDMDESFVRGRTFNTALLATTYVDSDLDQACAVGAEAIDLASGLQSRRSIRYIQDLQRRLDIHRDEPIVRRFNEQAADFMTRVSLS